MRRPILICLLALAICVLAIEQTASRELDFKSQQRRYPRVRAAFAEKSDALKTLFQDKSLQFPPAELFLRIIKDEDILQVWVRGDDSTAFSIFQSYPICYFSGELGPKRQQGDLQLPEGLYHIDRFNPASRFHLSLGINYPNASDRILGNRRSLGGDIFIHGDCVSIGCAAMTDERIKEIYVLAVESKNNGQRQIPVFIYPTQMNDAGMQKLQGLAGNDEAKWQFWQNLKESFSVFERTRQIPRWQVDRQGRYRLANRD